MDLKQFWEKEFDEINSSEDESHRELGKQTINFFKYRVGMFFWERGGKQFVKRYFDREFINEHYWAKYNNVDCCIDYAKEYEYEDYNISDFLDCLACLGEERVKELIKELEGKGN